jgi:hypothetical protein
VAEARPGWDDNEPPPWLDDDLPMPTDDWQLASGGTASVVPPSVSRPAEAAPDSDRPQRAPEPPTAKLEPAAAKLERPSNGHGNGNGNGNGNGAAQAAAPDTQRQADAPRVAHQPPSNGANGNGHGNGNGHSHGNAPNGRANGDGEGRGQGANRQALRASSMGTPNDQPPKLVVISIEGTSDKERDKRRMKRLHGLLTSYPGDDLFEFSVHDYDERRYQLRFPNDTTGFCADLERLLHELLGPEAVAVRTL